MKVRVLGAAAAALLVMTGLTGCRTNVGTAAVVDGHRITESDVGAYITATSQPIKENAGNGTSQQVSPRSFVLAQLLNEQLGFTLLKQIPSTKTLTPAQLDVRLTHDLGNRTEKSVAESFGLKGYAPSFDHIVLRVQEIRNVIGTAQQQGLNLQNVFSKLHFPVSVNPRYGKWDPKTFTLITSTVIPSYLTVQPGQSSAAGTQ